MIEVRLFATLRQGREKIIMLESEPVSTVSDILRKLDIPAEEVSILLVNGFHKKTVISETSRLYLNRNVCCCRTNG